MASPVDMGESCGTVTLERDAIIGMRAGAELTFQPGGWLTVLWLPNHGRRVREWSP